MPNENAAVWLVDRHLEQGRGARVALRADGTSHTYAELHGAVRRAQGALATLGVARGERLALVVDDEPAFPAWFLGAMRGGVVPVPLSTMLTAAELAPIVADSEATAILVSQRYAEHLPAIAAACARLRHAVVIGDLAAAGAIPPSLALHAEAGFPAAAPAPADTARDAPAFWLYSSGTTGVPKGVIHVHANLRATAECYAARVLRTTPDDRFFSVAKLFFAYGLGNGLTFPLAVGGTALLDARRPTPASVLETIAAERPTLFFASPGFLASLLDADPPREALASVRAAVTAGEALPAGIARRYAEHFGHPVLDGIGSTEALHIFISNTLERQVHGSSGFPVPGYELELRDDDGRSVEAADTPGALHVRGPSTAVGYWRRPEQTAAVFQDGWLRTGDVYTRGADGAWTCLGRNSDMIKAGGIWVSPSEVEAVLVEHDDVLEAAVVGARTDDGLETTVAFVVPRAGRTIDPAALVAHCRERMAAFKRPRRVEVVDTLPKTPTGKIRRFALRDALAGLG